jgi:DNA-binding MarR family transcriptional regulator
MCVDSTYDPAAVPDQGTIKQYVDEQLFSDTIDSLAAHIDRKKALADPVRYSLLYLLYDQERMPRKQLADATGLESSGLQYHLRDLLDANLIAETPTPDEADGRVTYYRITTLGKQEIDADIHNITGTRAE